MYMCSKVVPVIAVYKSVCLSAADIGDCKDLAWEHGALFDVTLHGRTRIRLQLYTVRQYQRRDAVFKINAAAQSGLEISCMLSGTYTA